MDQNENITPPIDTPTPVEAPAPAPEAPQEAPAKKFKSLITLSVITTILAIAGIAFGIYGIFFQTKETCQTNCAQNQNNYSVDILSTDESPLTITEATALVEKYGFEEQIMVFGDSLATFIDNYDQNAKLVYAIHESKDNLSEANFSSVEPVYTRTISYEDLNNKYNYYYGGTLEKSNYELKSFELIKMEYTPDNDLFTIYYRDGLGGYSTTWLLNRIISVSGTDESPSVITTSVTIDADVRQSKEYSIGTSSDGKNEYYDIYMDKEDLKIIQESLKAYKFNFTKKDGEYKLVSIEKL